MNSLGLHPSKVGRYDVIRKIASGGMADVYLVALKHTSGFERKFALKLISPHWAFNEDFVKTLVDEAKILQNISHTNIVQIIELDQQGELHFIVMEYVNGADLRRLMYSFEKKQTSMDLMVACYIINQVALGLQYAHELRIPDLNLKGVIHRDVSPQNILIGMNGEVKLTDFGIAKIMGSTSETATGFLKGKFSYMSPEQTMGKMVDGRSDIFSLGIVFYELVTGKRLFKGENDFETMESIKHREVSFPAAIPSSIQKILDRSLRKNPAERYQDMNAFRLDLERFQKLMNWNFSSFDFVSYLKKNFRDLFDWSDELAEEPSVITLPPEITSGSAATMVHATTEIDYELRKIKVGEKLEEKKAAPTQTFKKETRSEKLLPTLMPYFLLVSVLISILFVSYYFYFKPQERVSIPIVALPDSQEPLPLPELIEEKSVVVPPSAPEPAPALMAVTPEKTKTEHEKNPATPGEGTLTIRAVPWAYMSVGKKIQKKEVQAFRTKLKEGTYELKFEYPPKNIVTKKSIRIQDEKKLACRVDLRVSSEIHCSTL